MAVKQVELPNIGAVKLYKRKGSRSIRISIAADGEVRVTLPYWLPYAAATNFALSKSAWIQEQKSKGQNLLQHGQAIGKSHHLYFANREISKPATRIAGTTITITHSPAHDVNDPTIQELAKKASFRALRLQAATLLPQRLSLLAKQYGFTYNDLSFKRLKGRWGSCDNEQNITLNIFLMQLPWEFIDYVLLHELVHTKVLHHGPKFWAELERCLPHAKRLRKEIRRYQPIVGG